MAISFVSGATVDSGTTNNGANTLSLTVPTVLNGDFAVYALSRSNQVAITTAPSGFTLANTINVSTTSSLLIYYKVLNGTESATTLTSSWGTASYSSAGLVVYRGVSPSVPFDATTTTATKTATSTTVTFPTITTVSTNDFVVRIAGTVDSITAITYTTPASHNARVQTSSARTTGSATNAGVSIFDILQPTAAIVASTTSTSNVTTTDATATLALNPVIITAVTATGSITLTGNGAVALTYPNITGTGAIALVGAANDVLTFPNRTSTGALTLVGTATVVLKYPVTATGSISLIATGTPNDYITYPRTATGAITLVGTASSVLTFPNRTSTGAIALVGAANVVLTFPNRTATGAITLVGTATAVLKYPVTATGAITLVGTATAVLKYPVTATGAILISASPITNYSKIDAGLVGWGIPI